MVKNLLAMQIWVPSLGQEDPLEKGLATYSSILAWRTPWTEVPSGLQFMGSLRVLYYKLQRCLLLFSCSVMFNSVWPHELQHARLPCTSLSPRACSNSCPLSRWCHPSISSSVVPFCCFQTFSASECFLENQLFPLGGQSTGVSASASVFPMNVQDWSPLGWTAWISLQSKGLSRVFSNTIVQKYQFFGAQPFLWSNSHIHTWLLAKA